jgi:DNA-binding NarL/FixJ family response regulator
VNLPPQEDPTEGRRIRVMVVDRAAIARAGLTNWLSQVPTIEVVGAVTSNDDAVTLAAERAPDVVVIDPAESGAPVLRGLLALPKRPGIVVLATTCTREKVVTAIEAGAHAYVSREAEPEELLTAINSVASRRFYMCARVTHEFLEAVACEAAVTTGVARGRHVSRREREILTLIGRGNTDRQIAALLGLSVKTVHTHRKNIMQKLGVHNASSLVRRAMEMDLID